LFYLVYWFFGKVTWLGWPLHFAYGLNVIGFWTLLFFDEIDKINILDSPFFGFFFLEKGVPMGVIRFDVVQLEAVIRGCGGGFTPAAMPPLNDCQALIE